jgi:hypothetical protein
MVFERSSPSGYFCEPFTALVSRSLSGIVPAGFAGDSACLLPSIAAVHRHHKLTYPGEASASRAPDEVSKGETRRTVSKISGLSAYEAIGWIASSLFRTLGNGKNAGG